MPPLRPAARGDRTTRNLEAKAVSLSAEPETKGESCVNDSGGRPRDGDRVPALFLAGGGAFAIAKGGKINGSKLKKRSVAGKKLKRNTITGTEVNENKLGKVPARLAADGATRPARGTANVANSLSMMTTQ